MYLNYIYIILFLLLSLSCSDRKGWGNEGVGETFTIKRQQSYNYSEMLSGDLDSTDEVKFENYKKKKKNDLNKENINTVKEKNVLKEKYDTFLSNYPDTFEVQKVKIGFTHSYQMYTFLVKNNLRNDLLYFMKKNNIEASAHFDPPLHLQSYLKKYSRSNLKNTEQLSKQIVTLPMYPNLKNQEINKVLKTLERWCNKNE